MLVMDEPLQLLGCVDEDLNAREDYKDDFKVFTDEELRFIQDDVNNIYENTGYGMIYNGALCGIGDFALVPGPHVCEPKGIEDFDAQQFADAIDNCIIMEYDAICTVGVSDAIIPAIERATAAGIKVYTFNSDTSEECSRIAFHGQDLYGAGELAGETLAQLIGGEGKLAVITGLFSVPAHELRRTGGLASLEKYEGIAFHGQDPFGQGADPVIFAYNAIVTGEEAVTGNEWTKMDVVTPDNVAEYYPR